MAQRMVDDLDNTQFAEATEYFSLNGTAYEIDLSAENRRRLQEALQPFIAVARKSPARHSPTRPAIQPGQRVSRSHKTPPGRAEQLQAIRAWARQQGYDVSSRGRIPEAVQEAFEQAHQPAISVPASMPAFSSAT